MVPINNSDTAWLIVSDYNQDNDLPYEDLREDILNCNVNDWSDSFPYYHNAECIFCSGEASGMTDKVGGYNCNSNKVGEDSNIGRVGTEMHFPLYLLREGEVRYLLIGSDMPGRDGWTSTQVGGNRHDPH